MPCAASAGRSSRFHNRDCMRRELEDALADPGERLLWRQPVGRADGQPGFRLAEEPRNPDLEELVEIRRETRAELDALEQRKRIVGRELEDARVELEVRELAVEERVLLGSRFRRHGRSFIGNGWYRVRIRQNSERRTGLGGPPLGALPRRLERGDIVDAKELSHIVAGEWVSAV